MLRVLILLNRFKYKEYLFQNQGKKKKLSIILNRPIRSFEQGQPLYPVNTAGLESADMDSGGKREGLPEDAVSTGLETLMEKGIDAVPADIKNPERIHTAAIQREGYRRRGVVFIKVLGIDGPVFSVGPQMKARRIVIVGKAGCIEAVFCTLPLPLG